MRKSSRQSDLFRRKIVMVIFLLGALSLSLLFLHGPALLVAEVGILCGTFYMYMTTHRAYLSGTSEMQVVAVSAGVICTVPIALTVLYAVFNHYNKYLYLGLILILIVALFFYNTYYQLAEELARHPKQKRSIGVAEYNVFTSNIAMRTVVIVTVLGIVLIITMINYAVSRYHVNIPALNYLLGK